MTTSSQPPSPARRGTDRAIALGFNGMWIIGLVVAIRLVTVGAFVLAVLAAVGALLSFVAAAQMVLLLRKQWGRTGGAPSLRSPQRE
jgi:hypothetical protein